MNKNLEDDDKKQICSSCVGESHLSSFIAGEGKEHRCSYCEELNYCISIEALADRVEVAFKHHYARTSDQPEGWQASLHFDRESDYDWDRDGQPVLYAIEGAARIPIGAAEDVLEILGERHADLDLAAMGEETEFASDSHYEEVAASAHELHLEWSGFEKALKTEARFFSHTATELLARVFGGIDALQTRPRHPLVVEAGPGRRLKHLYRARVFQSESDLEDALSRPDLKLAPPPTHLAAAGRMNAGGISVFYGATNASVALAEVRPPVGSRVVVGKFNITQSLRLLDLTALDYISEKGSIFDPDLRQRLERIAFLRSLGQRMTRPVMPVDQAHDYLATQAIADFLATSNKPTLDGIIFQSAQSKGGRNVVLFHKAAYVETLQLPEGTRVMAGSGHSTEDGWEDDYWVSESVPKVDSNSKKKQSSDPFGPIWDGRFIDGDNERGNGSLSVDASTLEVHHIDWVKVKSTRFSVRRHRHEISGADDKY